MDHNANVSIKVRSVRVWILGCLGILCFSLLFYVAVPGKAAAWNLEGAIRSFIPDSFEQFRNYLLELNHDNHGIGQKLGLPLIELSLSRKDIATLLELHRRLALQGEGNNLEYYQSRNRWRKSTLRYNGQEYRILVKSHGRDPDGHKKGKFISLGIKLRDGKQLHQTKRFNLIIRERLPFWSISYLEFAQRFGLLRQRVKLVRVKINDWEEKLYYFERRLNDQEMEALGKSSMRRFRNETAGESDKSMIFTFDEPEIPYSERDFRKVFREVLEKSDYPHAHKQAYFDRYVAFNNAIGSGNVNAISKFLDLDYITSFVAAMTIGGLSGHVFLKPNFYVFFNNANGKFYPVLTRDIRQAVYRPGANETLEQLINRPGPPSPLARVPLFMTLSQVDQVRQEKYRKINRFLERFGEETIKSQYEEWKIYERLHLLGLGKLLAHKLGLLPYKDRTGAQFRVLRNYLRRARPQVQIGTSKGILSLRVLPNSMSELKFHRIFLNPSDTFQPSRVRMQVFSQMTGRAPVPIAHREMAIRIEPRGINLSKLVAPLRFSTALGKDSKAVDRHYTIHFEFDSPIGSGGTISKLDIGLTNAVTEEMITADKLAIQNRTSSQIIPWDSTLALPYPADPLILWQRQHPDLKVSRDGNDAVRLHSGAYVVIDDLVFPKGMKLILEAGTTIRIGAEKLVLAQNGLEVRGSESNPVVVTSLNSDAPFGSFAVLGQKGTHSIIRHLKLSNGSERWHEGVFYSGGLSIHYNEHVTIENSVFSSNHADDGVNIKNSEVNIKNSRFVDNAADQIDLDYCRGTVSESQFITTKSEDSNGDGIDVSGGEVLVLRSLFSGLGDKGVSVGEKSRIFLSNNEFIKNKTGVAVKDLSQAYFSDNRFIENQLDISVYQKKRIFGGGRAFIVGGPIKSLSMLKTKIDKQSHLRVLAAGGNAPIRSSHNTGEYVTALLNRLQELPSAKELFPNDKTMLMPMDIIGGHRRQVSRSALINSQSVGSR